MNLNEFLPFPKNRSQIIGIPIHIVVEGESLWRAVLLIFGGLWLVLLGLSLRFGIGHRSERGIDQVVVAGEVFARIG